jgi:predicted CXXCH cytochrome family protein
MVLGLFAANAALAQEKAEKNNVPVPDQQSLFTQSQNIPAMLEQGQLTVAQVPNPHWREDGCAACHAGKPAKAALRLRDADINRLCNACHDAVSPHSYIHPVGMTPSKDMQGRMPADFKQSIKRGGGKITCITCHDLPLQCLPQGPQKRGLNPLFFRAGPYRQRTDLCYRCHDPEYYQRLNAHDQVAKDGSIREDRCRICHSDAGDLKTARSINDVGFNVTGDLAAMCTGCHVWIPHPGTFSFRSKDPTNHLPNHLVVPPPDVVKQMRRMEKQNNIVLPLDPGTGKVFCGTCHNPHAKGVPMASLAATQGADADKRLRMQEICLNCHDK